ncbi:hypothetical protein F9K33_10765 [bacterium]|nr:MAG: hypothetical protein F9K33_10765 [bacterium]
MKRCIPAALLMMLCQFYSASAQDGPDTVFTRLIIDSTISRHFENPNSISLWTRTYSFYGAGVDTVYQLPDELIAVESETVNAGMMRLYRGSDYSIRYRRGEIHFSSILTEDLKITIQYNILPFNLRTEYAHRQIQKWTVDDSGRVSIKENGFQSSVPSQDNVFESSQMVGTGSITRGFTVGSNQDFTLNSGLNVQISGRISDDVTMEASLTDENIPIQPEGNTEKLQEIDKIFVEVNKADNYIATFGDFEVSLSGTEFGEYSRKLQGVRGAVRTDAVTADIAYASTKGKFSSNTLAIIEGNQGPYALSGSNGETNILVIAGTEKVWLNGVQLRRGEDNDFVIDYNSGQITFTRRRLITPESRVTVDFEYADDVFKRNTFASGIRTNWFDQQVSFGGVFINESDDKNNPINLFLSDKTIDSLSQIDDDQINSQGTTVYVDGARRVDFGRGAYIKVFDLTANDSIFLYVGADSSGDYNVRFTDFGAGNGDYVRGNILGEFIYAGKNNGSFLPLVALPLPTRTQLASFFLETRPMKNMVFGSEVAFSTFDKNSFSPEDINGKAYHLKANIQKQKIGWHGKKLGEFDLNARIRHIDSTFKEIDRINDPEFNRSWNIQGTYGAPLSSLGVEENLKEIQSAYRPVGELQFAGFYGDLKRGNNVFKSVRYGGGVQASFHKLPQINYSIEKINSDIRNSSDTYHSDVARQIFLSSYQLWKLKPGFDYEDENVRNRFASADSGFGTAYFTYRPRIDFNGFNKMQFGIMLETRLDENRNSLVDSLDGRVSTATTQRYYWNMLDWNNINSTVEYVRRLKEYHGKFRTVENLDNTSHLINSTVDYHRWNRAMTTSINYQVSEQSLQDRKLIFVPVQANTGNFIQSAPDSFIQVPQGQGDWIQSTVRVDGFTPIVEIKFGVRVRFEFSRLYRNKESVDTVREKTEKGFTGLLKKMSTETIFRIEENQKEPDLSVYFINLRKYQNSGNTLRGSLFFRQDVLSSDNERRVSVRLRYELQKNISGLLTDGNERRRRELENLRIRTQPFEKTAFESELEYETNLKRSTISVTGFNRDFDFYKIKWIPQITYTPIYEIEWINKGILIYSKDGFSRLTARSLSYAPELIYSFKNKGRAALSFDVSRVFLSKDIFVPFEMLNGLKKGWNSSWLLTMDYRINNHVSASLNYSGRKEPKQDVIHLGSAEFRAFF